MTAASSRFRASAAAVPRSLGPHSPICSRACAGRQAPWPKSPRVELLLDVDREYREKTAGDKLPKIAPKRFNPTGEAWLPILHAARGAWRFTALYSNTALAHQLGRERDWVVVYFHKNGVPEGQRTVVTEHRRTPAGRRIVRGREAECQRYYAATAVPTAVR